MSLTSAMNTGVSGLLSQAEGISVIGNNISNVNTTGFKGSRTLFSDMLSGPAANNSQIGRGVQIQKVDNIFGSGSFDNSTNVTDLAIQGDTFFVLGKPTATTATAVKCEEAFYTKAGAFKTVNDKTNNVHTLVNADGYKVLGSDGKPIEIPEISTLNAGYTFQKISGIDVNGTIAISYMDTNIANLATTYGTTVTEYYGGNKSTVVYDATGLTYKQIATAKFANPQGLNKVGGTLYQANENTSGLPIDGTTGKQLATGAFVATSASGTAERILSNYLEGSNVDMAKEMVSLITTQRAYSANSKIITTADDMTQEVLGLKR